VHLLSSGLIFSKEKQVLDIAEGTGSLEVFFRHHPEEREKATVVKVFGEIVDLDWDDKGYLYFI